MISGHFNVGQTAGVRGTTSAAVLAETPIEMLGDIVGSVAFGIAKENQRHAVPGGGDILLSKSLFVPRLEAATKMHLRQRLKHAVDEARIIKGGALAGAPPGHRQKADGERLAQRDCQGGDVSDHAFELRRRDFAG